MADLEERQDSAGTRRKKGAGDDPAFSARRLRPARLSPTRRLLFLLLVLAGLAWAIVGQAQLGTYAASGGGAAEVSVPPLTVILSLLSCIFVAVLLSWRDLQRRFHARYDAQAEPEPAMPAPRPTVGSRLRAVISRLGLAWLALCSLRWPQIRAAWREWLCALGVVVSLIASLIADLGARTFAGRPVAQWWWIGSAALLLVTAAVYTRLKRQQPTAAPAQPAPASVRRRRRTAPPTLASRLRRFWEAIGDPLLLVILLEVAVLLRLPNLTTLPYVVHGDEAACGLEAYRWLSGGVPSLISVGWYGLPVLGYGIPALFMKVVGPGLLGLRLSSVVIGVLTIALLYALAREFLGRRAAFVAAGLMTVANISIHFSRMGIHYIHAPFAVLLTLWMLVRSLRTNSPFAAVVAGVGLSVALQVYFSARIIFLIVPLFLVGLFIFQRQMLKGRLLALGWMLLSFVVSFGPLGVYFLQDTDAFKTRSAEVFIPNLTQEMRDHLLSQFGTVDLWTIFQRQLATVPLLVGGLPDQSLQYGPFYPMFDAVVAALMMIGFFYALLHLTRPLCLLLVIWVASTVAFGGVLTIDMPWWPRLLVMVPALCLLGTLALEEVLRLVARAWHGLEWSLAPGDVGRRWRAAMLGALLALVVLAYSGGQSIKHYFVDYGQEVNGVAYRALYTDIARYAAQLPAGTQVLLFSDDSIIWTYEPIRFLDTQVSGQRTGDPAELRTMLAQRAGPTVIIITLSRVDAFKALLSVPGALPAGKYQPQNGPDGQVAFYTYMLSS
ncbi:MAG TPA: glycosyltransferase family 39 protein [Ktedonobacterales bacterium]|nr:glycosyltransferase family 39 protein [Ktedonobacterales bacterium]